MKPGIDVSHYQGRIDWPKVKAAGIQFAYIKASQGAAFTDPHLKTNYAGAITAGIPVGLYHVFLPNLGQAAQIDFWSRIKNEYPAQLPAWCDVEPGAITEETADELLAFLAGGFRESDCIYCSPSTAQGYLSSPKFHAYGLAIAHYTDAPAPNTVQWSTWQFWQHSASGTVDGIAGTVDLDWFNGEESAFHKLPGLALR